MKKIPWWSPQIGKAEIALVNRVLKSNYPNEGNLTTQFEKKIAILLGVKHVICVTSGTAAIYLSLKALGIGINDEVIVPDLTFIATANAVEMTGAKAVLADIDPKTLMLDTNKIEKLITKKTKAIIPVHVSGRHANLNAILRIAKKNKIYIVEDAAEAFMSKYSGKFLGTFGITGCFSLSPAKIITTGQGGIITTNDDDLYYTLRKLKDQGRPVRGTGGDDIHDGLGFNFKFTDIQAAVGIGQLSYLTHRITRLIRNNTHYKKNLNDVKSIEFFACNTDEGEIPLWTEIKTENRNNLHLYLQKNGVDSRKFWYPIHQQNYYKSSDKNFPHSSSLSSKLLWLPSSFLLKDIDIIKICSLIKKFYVKNN